MSDNRWFVAGQVVRITLFPSLTIDVIGSTGLSPSRATATSNSVFQGPPNTISSRNTCLTWFCGVWIVSAVVRFFGGALGGGDSCSERFFFVDMVCQVLSVSIVTGSDSVFVYRCENVVIIGFIIVYVLLRLGGIGSYIKQLTGNGRTRSVYFTEC